MHFGFFDGATNGGNPGPIGVGFCIYDNSQETIIGSGPGPFGTNNEAEYMSLIWLMETAADAGIRALCIYGDSQLIINQVTGKWTASEKFQAYIGRFHELKERFTEGFSISWIKREKNKRADQLSKHGISLNEKKVFFKKPIESNETRSNDDCISEVMEKPDDRIVKADKPSIRIGKRFALVVYSDMAFASVDLKNWTCSCARKRSCEHIVLIEESLGELKIA